MKLKNTHTNPYDKFIRKLFIRTIAILGISGVLVFMLRTFFKGKFANKITQWICRIYDKSWEEGVQLYRYYISRNLDTILIVTSLILFFIILRIYLGWFTQYFDQISRGIDNLASEADETILMSSDLKFMETKLNDTKRKLSQRAEETKLAEKRKNELVVYLAHDIKTPLTSVIGYLNLLEESPQMTVEQKADYIHIALEKAYRLETLINEFFEITRYNFQDAPLEREMVSLCYMMIQVADELYPQLSASDKSVKLDIPEELMIYADPDKIARVLNNILKNAIAYSDPQSDILVFARHKKEQTIIIIKNKGSIPTHKLDSIFTQFYRLDESRTSTTGGSGLGLAIAKDIVELHGGCILAKSDEEHTWFKISLPDLGKNNV